MLQCNSSGQESVVDSLSHAVRRLHHDLDNICHNVFKIQNNDLSMSTQIRCKVDGLSGSHRSMQKSVDIAQIDIQEIKNDMTAMHVQLDELSAEMHEPNVLVQEVNKW